MKQKDTARRQPRMDRRIAEHVHDPYKTRRKLPGGTVCLDCGAVYEGGRWHWPSIPLPEDAPHEVCQACRRIRDAYPAGWLTIDGGFLAAHEDEIVHLVRHQEALEKGEHPLHRIMDITPENGGLVVTTTDIHLPRRIGEALRRAYEGELTFHYEEEAYRLRVHWTRGA